MIFHKDEITKLEHHYAGENNEIVMLYGDRFSDLSSTLTSFLGNKPFFYYKARNCSPKLQLQFFYDEIREDLPKGTSINVRYSDIISAMLSVPVKKRIIVVDEFQYIVKSEPEFMDELIRCIHNKWNNQAVLFILSSTQENWINKYLIEELKEKAYEIDSIIHLKNPDYNTVCGLYKGMSMTDRIMMYSVFGSSPLYLKNINPEISFNENIYKNVLTLGSFFYSFGMNCLPEELREHSVYNTILQAMASGRKKLNDIYKLTGFDRAKISVYLKNLIDLSLVEKIESFDTPGKENTQKGLYQITDPFIRFWFCFVYPHYSKLKLYSPEKFYKKYIEPDIRSFCESTFIKICEEYMLMESRNNRLDFHITKIGSWFGKVGNIDIIAQDDTGHTICCMCYFSRTKMSYSDYEWNKYCISQAMIKCDRLYLFSPSSFDDKLLNEGSMNENLYLKEGDMF